ncbi:MAG: hypothetical protein ABIA47_01140 [bacterium]
MILRGIDFGHVQGASGVQGFFGEGYWFHKVMGPLLTFRGMTFTAKTTTLEARDGNMPLKKDGICPKELFPRCIWMDRKQKIALNAVGLSGPGLEFLLDDGRWQARTEPFFLSFMSVASGEHERLREYKEMVRILRARLPEFRAPVGLKINLTCPNTGHDPMEFVGDAIPILEIVQELGIPIVVKINVMWPTEAAKKVAEHSACDAIQTSNTIPWRTMPDKIDWYGLFGPDEQSPLQKRGIPQAGGLSGRPLLPLVLRQAIDLRSNDIDAQIIAGGGVLSPQDGCLLMNHSAVSAIALGSIAMLGPHKVQPTIKAINKMGMERQK